MKRTVLLLMVALLLGACQSEEPAVGDAPAAAGDSQPSGVQQDPQAVPEPNPPAEPRYDIQTIIASAINDPDRPQTDKDRDAQRQPAKVIAFSGAAPGMNVFDLFTGGGYYGELMSRIVGSEGEVWVHNPPQFYERFGSADLDDRLAEYRLANVTRHDRPVDDLALPGGRFDLVVAAMVFHDLFWLTSDVPGVLSQLNESMRPGAEFLITDHAAPDGTGADMATDPNGKHRIDEAYVIGLMQSAGFELVDSSDILRVAEDDRTMAFFEPDMRGKLTDRFVLLFRKPK